MKFYKISFILIISAILFSCSENSTAPNDFVPPRNLTFAEKKIVRSAEKFSFKLFREINQNTSSDSNIFISPLSVSMALGMTLNGADGSTYDAMKSTLEFEGLTQDEINQSYQSLIQLLTGIDKKVDFRIANSIWYRDDFPVKQDFIDVNREFFDALVQALDFSAPNAPSIINAWVEDNTNGKIKEIIQQINAQTMMFLINAIYFKGIWKFEFDPDETQDDTFYLSDGGQANCKMMSQKSEFGYYGNDQFQAVRLPYNDGAFGMTIILPFTNANIDSIISNLDANQWNNLINSFADDSVEIYLPKFKIKYDLVMNSVLKTLGMSVAFDPVNADFTKIYQGMENLFISKVKHKTFVDVNEEGTEAAAVTVVEMELTSAGNGSKTVRVDHPFIFVIDEKYSGSILFMGKIAETIIEEE